MRILVFTQKVDKEDSVLGFFHMWLVEFSKRFDSVNVICLEKGKYDLPENVKVYSLGKDLGLSKIAYVKNFFKYLKNLSGSYDSVFVHMNQEYVLLGGLYWKLKRIPVYLWRNHPKGDLRTYIAVLLSTKVFCTSKESFTKRFNKTVLMPVGVDTGVFKIAEVFNRKKYSVCMVGRISPIKHVALGIEAINVLTSSGIQVSLSVIGPVLPRDEDYFAQLKEYVVENNLNNFVSFLPALPIDKIPEVFNNHQICLNLTDSGSFDKTIVEAAACGVTPLVSNASMKGILPEACMTTPDKEVIANSIKNLLPDHVRINLQKDLENFVNFHSLSSLMTQLLVEIKSV